MLADPNGNIMQTHNQQGAKTLYGRSNMPFHVQTNSTEYIHYLYSVTDQRIYVETQNNTAGGIPAQTNSGEYYLINAAGNVVSIYNKANVNDATFYFYGADGRIGHYDTHLAKTTAYVKDYLGNTRITLTSADPANPIENVYDYLPYGDILKTHQTGQTNEKYLSTENERDLATGLDYRNARYSDPIVGRFLSVDPLAGDAPNWTPYRYCFDNPINLVDPSGLWESTDVVQNPDGSYTVVGAYNDNNIHVVNNSVDKKRTGKVIGQTENPWDFMDTNDETGEYTGFREVSFDLNNLPDGNKKVNEITKLWSDLGVTKINNAMVSLVVLAKLSANGNTFDIKTKYSPATGGEYTAVSYFGKITTARNLGNINFGANMRAISDQSLIPTSFFYHMAMPVVGAYNQYKNNGNGYNSGTPFYGEHEYSGTGVYQGYFGIKP